jgi:Ca-activated chloride channel homolog
MKLIGVCFLAAVLITGVAFAPSREVSASQSQQKPQPPDPQSKSDKDKKPAEEDVGQDEPIKLGTQLVTVPFNVTDKTNRYINDLTKDDLELLEDTKPQQVFSFERQTDLPITVAMLIDISGSQKFTLSYERVAGQRFFKRVLRPRKDIGAVVTFEGETELVQGLTSDVDKLNRALDSVEVPPQIPSIGGVGGTPPINGGSRSGATSMYDAIYVTSSDLLRREAGRRVIVLITDGVDTSSRLKEREAIERTWRSEVIVYAIGIGDPGWGGINQGTLKKIASETGGRAYFPRNEEDLDKAFAQIDEDLRSQYVLAYQPTNENGDGSFRVIQLKVKNRKELMVRHRRGYFAPTAKKS